MDHLAASVQTAEFRILLENLVGRVRKRRRAESSQPVAGDPSSHGGVVVEEEEALESTVERFKTEAQLEMLTKKVASMSAALARRDGAISVLETKVKDAMDARDQAEKESASSRNQGTVAMSLVSNLRAYQVGAWPAW